MTERDVWRCVWVVAGAQCVVRGGLMKMLVMCAVDWDIQQKVLNHLK